MAGNINDLLGRTLIVSAAVCGWRFYQPPAVANPLSNPSGGTVVSGSANFNTSGSHETITTSSTATINWSSFNIGVGYTTTFVQPTSTSVVWNQVNSANPSQILGTLNANGFVILQNQAGIYIGGDATINTHGLILSTAGGPAPNLSSGGAWQFDVPPPKADIVNCGQINIAGGGPAFLLANDIENNGTISAPGGRIGLYAGEKVLISSAPDGRGLSTEVTLPQGSVDNEGKLIVDAGSIVAQAKTVNQNGLLQANSVQEVNGTIELVASDSLNLGANSVISAKGDTTGVSAGGSVTITSANNYADAAGSAIDISGGAQGGNGGEAEICSPNMVSFASRVVGQAVDGFADGAVTIDPANVYLTANGTAKSGYTSIAFSSFTGDSINVMADQNIEIGGIWTLANATSSAQLSLTAGNSITLDNNAGISAGNKWGVSLTAGTAFVSTPAQPIPASGTDGIYLNPGAYIQTQDGSINLWAMNEVNILDMNSTAIAGNDGIRTLNGGSITVNAIDGGVNTGYNSQGYLYNGGKAPYYTVSPTVGGISTAAGGNVTIYAGGNVTSYLPDPATTSDAGTGTFGAQAGNLTINAGGTVVGNYVVANGVGTINAGANVGNTTTSGGFALSLISGSWVVNAPDGDIYLQEVLNPNGVFNNNKSSQRGGGLAGQYLFNYSPDDSVSLNAEGVTLTSQSMPRLSSGLSSTFALYPPILDINAGSGGVTLEGNVTLFPSPDQNLNITTTDGGSFSGENGAQLFMSDSSSTRWINSASFTTADQSATLPAQAANPNPVEVTVAGNMQNLTLITSKETSITVDGNMLNCGFSGQNLHADDITSITVGGQIFNQGAYAFVNSVSVPGVPSTDLLPGIGNNWDAILALALNPSAILSPSALKNKNIPQSQWLASIVQAATLFNTTYANGKFVAGGDQGLVYNTSTGQLAFGGQMSATVLSQLTQPFTILTLVNGAPVIGANGKFETQTVNWINPAQLATLYTESQPDSSPLAPAIGYRIGGPGAFDIAAGSISLGNSYGILSCGVVDPAGGFGRYGDLASVTPQGAAVNVTVTGDLSMLTSTIATLGGGNVDVTSTGGSMDLGTEGIGNSGRQVGLGVYSSGGGDVSVTAYGDVDIDGSRVGTYDGGNIIVESFTGNVNVGSGGNTVSGAFMTYVNPATGLPGSYAEDVFGSGIVAFTLVPGSTSQGFPPADVATATLPGSITVTTPEGNISTSQAGILQLALDGSSTAGPFVDLSAGSEGYIGNIDLGDSGVIGGTIKLSATGKITGQFVGRQEIVINAAQGFDGTGVAPTIEATGPTTGTLVGQNVSVSGASTANIQSQSASVNGGPASSTLGRATASAASQSAAQQANNASQQLANNDPGNDKQKDDQKPVIKRVKRVTVFLPKTT